MCHPTLLVLSSLGEVMPVQLAQVFSVELRAQPGSVGPLGLCLGWVQLEALLLSCSAEQQLWLFSSLDSFAMRLQDWAYLQLSVPLEKW